MRYSVHSDARPKSVAKSLSKALRDEGHPRSLVRCQGLVARMYGYRGWSDLSGDIGRQARSPSDADCLPETVAERRRQHVQVLVADGVPVGLAEAVVRRIGPTSSGAFPSVPDGMDGLRTAEGVVGRLRACADALPMTFPVHEAGTVTGRGGTWHVLRLSRDGEARVLCISEDGCRVFCHVEGLDERTSAERLAEDGMFDSFDLAEFLDMIGFRSPPSLPLPLPRPDTGTSTPAARVLDKLRADVLCELRCARLSCELYRLWPTLPDKPGSVRRMVVDVPVLGGWLCTKDGHVMFVDRSTGWRPDTSDTLGSIVDRLDLDPARLTAVLAAMRGRDVLLRDPVHDWDRIIAGACDMADADLPSDEIELKAMVLAMVAARVALGYGCKGSDLFRGVGGRWAAYLRTLGRQLGIESSDLDELGRDLAHDLMSVDKGREVALDLTVGFAALYGEDREVLKEKGVSHAIWAKLRAHLWRGLTLSEVVSSSRAYAESAALAHDGDITDPAYFALPKVETILGGADPMLPTTLRGKGCRGILDAIGFDGARLRDLLRRGLPVVFDDAGDLVPMS